MSEYMRELTSIKKRWRNALREKATERDLDNTMTVLLEHLSLPLINELPPGIILIVVEGAKHEIPVPVILTGVARAVMDEMGVENIGAVNFMEIDPLGESIH